MESAVVSLYILGYLFVLCGGIAGVVFTRSCTISCTKCVYERKGRKLTLLSPTL